jgi:glycosyltransferase involved in cell wall biosynthesis
MSIRVGFVVPTDYWRGGKNYLLSLFNAIRAADEQAITPVIFTGVRHTFAAEEFPGAEIITSSILDKQGAALFVRNVINKTTRRDLLVQRLLERHDVSVMSHSFHLGKQRTVKTIGWIPDFQHVHLPEFFQPEERVNRDRHFMSMCVNCDKVVVSSECAREDLIRFSPENAHKAELLRFVGRPTPTKGAASLPELQKLYKFDGPYFLLPNQFWVHKNHRSVIAALHRLKQQNQSILVLATGSSQDYRNPTYFPSLMEYTKECGVSDQFRILGDIPFAHLAGLMRHSIAFLNPSRFEGWSTSVEEAKSMGKQIVLSDIPVHREQAPERGIFFDLEDPSSLADAILTAYNGFDHAQDESLQQAARNLFPARQLAFGQIYINIVHRAAQG